MISKKIHFLGRTQTVDNTLIPINKLPCARHHKITLNDLMKHDDSEWHWIPNGSSSVWGYIKNEKFDKYLTVMKCPNKMPPCPLRALPTKTGKKEQLWRKWGEKIISKKEMPYKEKPLVLTLDSDDKTVIAKSPANGENQEFFLKKLAKLPKN